MTHSVLKPQKNIKRAPEQRTYTKLVSTLACKPEDNLKVSDDLNLVASDKDIHAEGKEGAGHRRQTNSTLNKVNDPIAVEAESETLNVIHSALKLQGSKDKTP